MKTTIIAIASAAVLALLAGGCSDNEELDAATSPQEFISLMIPGAKVQHIKDVRRTKDSLLITYVNSWSSTGSSAKNSFNVDLARIVPRAFYKFHDVNSITITVTASFVDIRGRDGYPEDILRATFSRANAASIVWDHIVWADLPLLADEFWQRPNFIKDAS